MYDGPLDHDSKLNSDELDQRLIHALEAAPATRIPADFASRLVAGLPARPHVSTPPSITVTHYGRTAMLAGILIMLVAMLTFARGAGHPTFQLAMEWTLFAQFVACTVWFTTRRSSAG